MKELREIVDTYNNMDAAHQQAALATVVHVEGSSYRRPGARMLIKDNGEVTGAISGGCLEGDVLRKAQLVILEQQPMLVTYDTTNDEDDTLGIQLGCNGIVHILIEPIDASNPNHPIAILQTAIQQRQKAVLATFFSLKQRRGSAFGTRLVQLENGHSISTIANNLVAEKLAPYITATLQNEVTQLVDVAIEQQPCQILLQYISPGISLLIAGAGNDAIPVMQLANLLGWHTTIVDGRPNYATQARFPLASQIMVAKPGEVLNRIVVDKQTAVVLMTHNYQYDIALLRELFNQEATYIGVLGPRQKLQRMLSEMEEGGIVWNEQNISNIYGPTGLDIGAETAEEIAVAIIAEIQAVFSHRPGNPLRNKPAAIHAPALSTIPQSNTA